jgi:hypothetical protein
MVYQLRYWSHTANIYTDHSSSSAHKPLFTHNSILRPSHNIAAAFKHTGATLMYLGGREAAGGGLARALQDVLRAPGVPRIPHAVQTLQR